jgi:FkbH-like protein
MSLTQDGKARPERKTVKCVVWDLDDTLWEGVLPEGDEVRLSPRTIEIIKTLDSRGILQSIASKNDHERAMAKLQEFGLCDYFLYPQINWNSKSSSLEKIAASLNIGLDSLAFVDDQPFELEEVSFSLPEVLCIRRDEIEHSLSRPELNPANVTEDARSRRLMYLSEARRQKDEEEFVGPHEEFLASLDMVLTISQAREEHLRRAVELTERTNQMNSTGYTYSYEELDAFRQSPRHSTLVAALSDKYGSYGTIGLSLIELGDEAWNIKLLLTSCRVMSRGVGSLMLNHIMRRARARGVSLRAEFLPTGRNRMMFVAYKFAGFTEIERVGDLLILEHDLASIPPPPSYVKVIVEEDNSTLDAERHAEVIDAYA